MSQGELGSTHGKSMFHLYSLQMVSDKTSVDEATWSTVSAAGTIFKLTPKYPKAIISSKKRVGGVRRSFRYSD